MEQIARTGRYWNGHENTHDGYLPYAYKRNQEDERVICYVYSGST